jgi:hypothetical protein
MLYFETRFHLIFQTNIIGLKHFSIAESLKFNTKCFIPRNNTIFEKNKFFSAKIAIFGHFTLLPWLQPAPYGPRLTFRDPS